MNSALRVTLQIMGLGGLNEAVEKVNSFKSGLGKAGQSAVKAAKATEGVAEGAAAAGASVAKGAASLATVAGIALGVVAAVTLIAGAFAGAVNYAMDLANSIADMSEEMQAALGEKSTGRLKEMKDSVDKMKATWKAIKDIIATWIAPLVTKLANWISGWLGKLAKNLNEAFDLNINVDDYVEEVVKAENGIQETQKELKKNTVAVKALNRTIAGFDELEKLASAINSGGGSGTVSPGSDTVAPPAITLSTPKTATKDLLKNQAVALTEDSGTQRDIDLQKKGGAMNGIDRSLDLPPMQVNTVVKVDNSSVARATTKAKALSIVLV